MTDSRSKIDSGARATVRRAWPLPITSRRRILVTLAERPHPFPSRTRKLSSPAPKILRGQPFGKIGRRQDFCVSGAGLRPPSADASTADDIRRRTPDRAASRPALPPAVSSPRTADVRDGCPFLAARPAAGGWPADRDHRCAASDAAVRLALEKQRRLCLTASTRLCDHPASRRQRARPRRARARRARRAGGHRPDHPVIEVARGAAARLPVPRSRPRPLARRSAGPARSRRLFALASRDSGGWRHAGAGDGRRPRRVAVRSAIAARDPRPRRRARGRPTPSPCRARRASTPPTRRPAKPVRRGHADDGHVQVKSGDTLRDCRAGSGRPSRRSVNGITGPLACARPGPEARPELPDRRGAGPERRQRWQPRQYDVMNPPALTSVIRVPQRGQASPPLLWTARKSRTCFSNVGGTRSRRIVDRVARASTASRRTARRSPPAPALERLRNGRSRAAWRISSL